MTGEKKTWFQVHFYVIGFYLLHVLQSICLCLCWCPCQCLVNSLGEIDVFIMFELSLCKLKCRVQTQMAH